MPKNEKIECFIKERAYEFAKKKLSVTYLVVNEEDYIIAIFTLAHKAVEIHAGSLSKTRRKKMERYAALDTETNSYTVSAFLIAQLGKNYALENVRRIQGNSLMDMTFEVLEKAQHDIGGGIVFLECEEKVQLLNFYQNENNGFSPFN